MRDLYEPDAYTCDDIWGKTTLEPLHNGSVDIEEDVYRRLHVYNRRIACLYAWMLAEEKITLPCVEAAHGAVETSLAFLRWVFADKPVSLQPWQAAFVVIDEKIIAQVREKPGISPRDLSNALRKSGGYSLVSERIEKLIKNGAIRLETRWKKKNLYPPN